MKKFLALLFFLSIGMAVFFNFFQEKTFEGYLPGWCDDCPPDYIPSPIAGEISQKFSCDISEGIISSFKECLRCPNREMVNKLCLLKCPKGKNRVGYNCFAPCPSGTVQQYYTGACLPCSELKNIDTKSSNECSKCPNREYKKVITQGMWTKEEDDRCILKKCSENTFRNESGDCVPCTTKFSTFSSKEECVKCSNREMLNMGSRDGYACVLKCENGCRTEGGSCFDFDINSTTTEQCKKCINREMINGSCVLKTCNEESFQDHHGECHLCDEILPVESLSEEECLKCPNRIYEFAVSKSDAPSDFEHKKCILKACPQNMLQDKSSGICHFCDSKEDLSTNLEECNKCPNRIYHNGICALGEDCPIGFFVSSHGECFSCENTDLYISSDIDQCNRCPNRELVVEKIPWISENAVTVVCRLKK